MTHTGHSASWEQLGRKSHRQVSAIAFLDDVLWIQVVPRLIRTNNTKHTSFKISEFWIKHSYRITLWRTRLWIIYPGIQIIHIRMKGDPLAWLFCRRTDSLTINTVEWILITGGPVSVNGTHDLQLKPWSWLVVCESTMAVFLLVSITNVVLLNCSFLGGAAQLQSGLGSWRHCRPGSIFFSWNICECHFCV